MQRVGLPMASNLFPNKNVMRNRITFGLTAASCTTLILILRLLLLTFYNRLLALEGRYAKTFCDLLGPLRLPAGQRLEVCLEVQIVFLKTFSDLLGPLCLPAGLYGITKARSLSRSSDCLSATMWKDHWLDCYQFPTAPFDGIRWCTHEVITPCHTCQTLFGCLGCRTPTAWTGNVSWRSSTSTYRH